MNQKTLVLALAALGVGALGFARQTKAEDQAEKDASGSKNAEVVAINAETKSITVKRHTTGASDTEPETLAVEGKALASLKEFQVGDKVLITCKPSGDAPVSTQQPGTQPGPDHSTMKAAACVVTEIAKAPEK